MSQELRDYIDGERTRGVSDSDLRTELVSKGWDAHLVDETMGTSAIPRALPTFTEILGASWNELVRNALNVFLIMLLPVGLALVAGLGGGALYGAYSVLGNGYGEFGMGSMLVIAIAIVVAMIALYFVSMAMIYRQIVAGWGLTFKEAFSSALPLVLPTMWVAILYCAIVTVGLVLLIIPGVIAMIVFCFGQVAVAVDGKRGIEALRASREAVKGRWLTVFLYMLGFGVLLAIANIILSLIPLVGLLVGFFNTPFSLIFSVRLYQGLKAVRGI